MPPSQPATTSQIAEPDVEFQRRMLDGVSRTFALTIPALPDELHHVVGNAYLLCRIVDTIEDEPALQGPDRGRFADQFVSAVEGEGDAAAFARELAPRLSDATIPAEKELIERTESVLAITFGFPVPARRALEACVRTMARGMVWFQDNRPERGVADQLAMDRYCYYVAGVVGEMLTELFCLHLPDALGDQREDMLGLGRSFGQGLQMTNILKDVWTDHERGYCWLPREVFARHGFELDDMRRGQRSSEFESGMRELVGVAHGHLRNAFEYTLRIPRSETGIRNFCLWALGMAVLNLRKLDQLPGYTDRSQVKISRRSVKATVALSKAFARSDRSLRLLFGAAARGLPLVEVAPVPVSVAELPSG